MVFFCIQNTSEEGLLTGLKRSGGTKKEGLLRVRFLRTRNGGIGDGGREL